ncbi:hypothetical protein SAMN02745121_05008 [Nannocystis exedens]|uniref:Uncharacterized protein n=1 Tax=Nannocystis exedens TaxID=54 RepID=A0A1I2CAB7_9BACT|nr:hypothetical protein [Nannocystis exedens]PCC68423.1 hypothetical protein NAEX_01437 [Nannocystis exedens]SFE65291.1 hypothetical protein SAMN02745121_05008 [Nannocystis exedens]
MLRRSPFLLLLAAAACFSDAPPSGLSTSGSVSATTTGTTAPGPDTTGPDTTSTSTSTSSAPVTTSATTTTTGIATTSTVTTGEPTTDDLTMGATGTSTSEPGTTDTGPLAACADAPTQFGCIECCQGTQGDWEVFRGNVAGCVCPDFDHPCFPGCFDSLCSSDTLAEACFGCFAADDPCVAGAVAECANYLECATFVGCLEDAACLDKP